METKLIAHQNEIQDRILDATERLLARYGYLKMTMEDIAREAGVGRRTIYLHFPSKEAVALSSIDRIVDRLLEKLGEVAASSEPIDVRLRKMLRTRVLFRFDSVRDYYQNFNDMFATLRPVYLARREQYFNGETRVFANVIREGQQSGELSKGDTIEMARTMIVATNSLLPYSLSARELGERKQVDRSVVSVADMLLDGLRERGKGARRE
jgi:AcrR family transcriptional regulator